MTKQSTSQNVKKTTKSKEQSIESMTNDVINSMENAISQIELLAEKRSCLKLSNSRVTSVAREMKELLKVMMSYCC